MFLVFYNKIMKLISAATLLYPGKIKILNTRRDENNYNEGTRLRIFYNQANVPLRRSRREKGLIS